MIFFSPSPFVNLPQFLQQTTDGSRLVGYSLSPATTAVTVIFFAAILDYLIGDPWGWPHPVRVMGWFTHHYTQLILKITPSQSKKISFLTIDFLPISAFRRFAGVVLAVGLIVGTAIISWCVVAGARWLHPLLAILLETVMLASCFAGRSLRTAAEEVLTPLDAGDILKARQILSNYVGRDTENLSDREILRAVLETVTENGVDGVMAPLFYALLGLFFPAIGPATLALAYKAASTLDSMVGYKQEPYQDLGWFSAKLEDVLTWVPCRLCVITLGLISGKLVSIWKLCQRDAIKDPSPNSGWSEGAYAAILGVQLGGPNYYKGVAKLKPLLGEPIYPITAAKIQQALLLTRYCFLCWLGFALLFAGVSWLLGNA